MVMPTGIEMLGSAESTMNECNGLADVGDYDGMNTV